MTLGGSKSSIQNMFRSHVNATPKAERFSFKTGGAAGPVEVASDSVELWLQFVLSISCARLAGWLLLLLSCLLAETEPGWSSSGSCWDRFCLLLRGPDRPVTGVTTVTCPQTGRQRTRGARQRQTEEKNDRQTNRTLSIMKDKLTPWFYWVNHQNSESQNKGLRKKIHM